MSETKDANTETISDAKKVKPSEFYVELAGKKRRVLFGNYALLQIEEKYGSAYDLEKVEKDIEEKPMKTLPFLLSICMIDKEGFETDDNGYLVAEDLFIKMDEEGKTLNDVMGVVLNAIISSTSNIGNGNENKTTKKKTK